MKLFTFSKDKHGRFTDCNEAFAKLVDLDSPKHVLGRTDIDMIWREQADFFRHCDIKVMNGNAMYNSLEQQVRHDYVGKVLVSKSPLIDSHGNVHGITGSFVDVSDYFIQNKAGHYDKQRKRFYLSSTATGLYFTHSEYQVFKLLLTGKSNQEIAHLLERSKRTIEAIISEIAQKLQCKTKLQIIHTAMQLGLTHLAIE